MSGKQSAGIGTHRIKGHVTEIEKTGEPDDNIEPPAEHDVGQNENAEIKPVAG